MGQICFVCLSVQQFVCLQCWESNPQLFAVGQTLYEETLTSAKGLFFFFLKQFKILQGYFMKFKSTDYNQPD